MHWERDEGLQAAILRRQHVRSYSLQLGYSVRCEVVACVHALCACFCLYHQDVVESGGVVGGLDLCGLLGAPVYDVMRSACTAALTTFELMAQFRLHCAHAEYRDLSHGPWLHCTICFSALFSIRSTITALLICWVTTIVICTNTALLIRAGQP